MTDFIIIGVTFVTSNEDFRVENEEERLLFSLTSRSACSAGGGSRPSSGAPHGEAAWPTRSQWPPKKSEH